MSKSSLLRVSDVRTVYELVGECRELGDDPTGWRRHLLARAAHLMGAAVTIEYEGRFLHPFRLDGIIEWGWDTTGFDRAIFVRIHEEYTRLGAEFNPMVHAYFSKRDAGRGPCLSRSDVLSDSQWYRSRYYQHWHAAVGIDALMYCMLPMPASGSLLDNLLVFVRPLGESDFTTRHRAIARELHEKITALIGGPLAGFHEPSPADLPPRVRQTLQCFLEGDSDKQAARRLSLGRHTINQYAKAIFAHFGVSSRTELLARWIRRGWGNKCAWVDQPPDLHAAQSSPPRNRRSH
jgi:DNA-binding CsgD family transcriptional regulator